MSVSFVNQIATVVLAIGFFLSLAGGVIRFSEKTEKPIGLQVSLFLVVVGAGCGLLLYKHAGIRLPAAAIALLGAGSWLSMGGMIRVAKQSVAERKIKIEQKHPVGFSAQRKIG